ncbi:MAG: kelch-like protein, partial [Chloroflexota bacterium]|nr:kelch-like protein [Chloroflexota bacterium]
VITLIGPMTVPRAAHSATLLPDGRVLLAGGCTRNSCELGEEGATAELYDPELGRFSHTGSMARPRVGHAAVLVEGRVLVLGGWDLGGVTASAELYDPATGIFSGAGSMRSRRGGFTATRLRDGTVLIAGGYDGGRYLSSAELYDPRTGRFVPTGRMVLPRTSHVAALLPDGRVLVAGGSTREGKVIASAEVYDPSTGKFSRTGNMTVARHKHGAARLPGGRILIVGGSDARDIRGRYASAEVYDPETGRFAATGEMATARFKLPDALAALPDGDVLVAGGGETAEAYDPGAGGFRVVEGSLGSDWSFATATVLRDGRVLIAGGYDGSIQLTARSWLYGQ